MGRFAALVPKFAVRDLPLGRTLRMISIALVYITLHVNAVLARYK